MKKFSVVIAEPSESIRRQLQELLKSHPRFEALTLAFDLQEAKDICDSMQADVLFISENMLQQSTLANTQVNLPFHTLTVCMSDSTDYAAQAFEHDAIDYLVHPISPERFNKCISKLSARLGTFNLEPLQQMQGLIKTMQFAPQAKKVDPLIIKESGRIRIVEHDSIMWVGGAGNYVELHLIDEDRPILYRETLTEMANKLADFGFVRIHRSIIVKKHFISELKPTENGDYLVTLKNGTPLNFSRRYKQTMSEIF